MNIAACSVQENTRRNTNCQKEIMKMFGSKRVSFLAIYLLAALVLGSQIAQTGTPFTDNFSSYTKNTCFADGTSFGPWTTAFSGYGCVQVESSGTQSWLDESPAVSMNPSETHASLVSGPSFSNPLSFSASVETVAQLRQGS